MVALALTVLGAIHHHQVLLVDKSLQLSEHSVLLDNFLSPYWSKMDFHTSLWIGVIGGLV